MFSKAFFVRILIAVVGAILVLAIVPPFLRIIGFPSTSDVMIIVRIVVAAVALWYVFLGSEPKLI